MKRGEKESLCDVIIILVLFPRTQHSLVLIDSNAREAEQSHESQTTTATINTTLTMKKRRNGRKRSKEQDEK